MPSFMRARVALLLIAWLSITGCVESDPPADEAASPADSAQPVDTEPPFDPGLETVVGDVEEPELLTVITEPHQAVGGHPQVAPPRPPAEYPVIVTLGENVEIDLNAPQPNQPPPSNPPDPPPVGAEVYSGLVPTLATFLLHHDGEEDVYVENDNVPLDIMVVYDNNGRPRTAHVAGFFFQQPANLADVQNPGDSDTLSLYNESTIHSTYDVRLASASYGPSGSTQTLAIDYSGVLDSGSHMIGTGTSQITISLEDDGTIQYGSVTKYDVTWYVQGEEQHFHEELFCNGVLTRQ